MLKIDYTPAGRTLEQFFYCDAFASGIRGPVGSGKSTACVFRPWRHLAQSEPDRQGIRRARWAIARNSYPELKTTTIKTWHEWFPRELGHWQDEGPPTHFIKVGGYDMEVMFLALDRPDDVRKLLSLELTGAWLNEAREMPKAILDAFTARVGRFPPARGSARSWSGVIMDTNPPDSDHWWYRLAEEETPDDYKFFAQPPGDGADGENRSNLPPNYYDRIKLGKDEAWVKVYVRGEYGFVQDGRPVYPEFREALHVSAVEPVPRWPLHIGIDFGLTPAAVFGQKSPMGAWRWIDELVTERAGATAFGEMLARKVRADFRDYTIGSITGDPAGEGGGNDEKSAFQLINAVLSKSNLLARPAYTNDPSIRREAVAVPLTRIIDGTPGLVVSPKALTLRKAMSGGYRYRRMAVTGTERYADKPEKNMFSHVAEAAQYLMLGGGEGKALVRRARPKGSNRPLPSYNPLDGVPAMARDDGDTY